MRIDSSPAPAVEQDGFVFPDDALSDLDQLAAEQRQASIESIDAERCDEA